MIVYTPVFNILISLYPKKPVLLYPSPPETRCVCSCNKTSQTITFRVMFSDIFWAVLLISFTNVILVIMCCIGLMSQSAIGKTMQCCPWATENNANKKMDQLGVGIMGQKGERDRRGFSEDFKFPWKQRLSIVLKAKCGVMFVVNWNTYSLEEVYFCCFSHRWAQIPDKKQPEGGGGNVWSCVLKEGGRKSSGPCGSGTMWQLLASIFTASRERTGNRVGLFNTKVRSQWLTSSRDPPSS